MAKKRTNRTAIKRSAPDWAERFLEKLGQCGVIEHAARLAIVGKRTVYERRDADPEFAAAMSAALESHIQVMEQEMIRRAVEGTERPVFHQGLECGRIREYSDTLLIFALKAKRPDVYRENIKHEHAGQMRHVVSARELTDEQLAAIVARGQSG